MMKATFVLLSVCLVICRATQVVGETVDSTDDEFVFNDGIREKDDLYLFFMFVLFGLIVSIFGSLLAYVSSVEDQIICKYKRSGVQTIGDVVSMEFLRGAGDSAEYFVTVEYTLVLSNAYPIRIRKQVRCMETDFWNLDQEELNQCHLLTSMQNTNTLCDHPCSPCNSDVEENENKRSFQNNQQWQRITKVEIVPSAASFVEKFQVRDQTRKLQLVVLPSHHLSALPVPQVNRRTSSRYRLYSIIFVVAAMSMSVFCFHLAAQFLLSRQKFENRETFAEVRPVTKSGLLYILFITLALLPIQCIHCFLHGIVLNFLQEEYFESGEIVKGGAEDDSSLSTWNTGSIRGCKTSVGSLSTMV